MMGTLFDYIKWRGDLEFWQDGFNVTDNLVLSCLSYVPLDKVFEKYGKEIIDVIVGWKEDFMLALKEVEAERQAVAFLNSIASENDCMV